MRAFENHKVWSWVILVVLALTAFFVLLNNIGDFANRFEAEPPHVGASAAPAPSPAATTAPASAPALTSAPAGSTPSPSGDASTSRPAAAPPLTFNIGDISEQCVHVLLTVMDYGPTTLRMNFGGEKAEFDVPPNTPRGDGIRGIALLKGYSRGKKIPLDVTGQFESEAPLTVSKQVEFVPGAYYSVSTGGHVDDSTYHLSVTQADESDFRTFKGTHQVTLKECKDAEFGVRFMAAAKR